MAPQALLLAPPSKEIGPYFLGLFCLFVIFISNISPRIIYCSQTSKNILHISLNGKETVVLDPREADAEFLKRKEGRNSTPAWHRTL